MLPLKHSRMVAGIDALARPQRRKASGVLALMAPLGNGSPSTGQQRGEFGWMDGPFPHVREAVDGNLPRRCSSRATPPSRPDGTEAQRTARGYAHCSRLCALCRPLKKVEYHIYAARSFGEKSINTQIVYTSGGSVHSRSRHAQRTRLGVV